jgi:integrase/recombinase XerD
MLSVYARHHPDCANKDDSTWRRCRCPKWLDGTLPGRKGRFRVSAKTKFWEQAELLAREYEHSAIQGEEIKPAKMPTVKEAVKVFLGDAEARGLASATLQKLHYIFEVQLLDFAEEAGPIFLNEFNPRNLTEWRQSWREKELARKKKFERVIVFFWFCVRQGWLRENPTATMGRVISMFRRITSRLRSTSASLTPLSPGQVRRALLGSGEAWYPHPCAYRADALERTPHS